MLLKVHDHDTYCYTGGKAFDPIFPSVVFIHGAQNDHSVWILQSRYFAHHGFSVLALDLPGHGRSQGTPLTTIEALADWLLALLDAAGVSKAILAGHSMGSLIALEVAARSVNRITGIGLIGTAYPMQVADTLLNAANNTPQKAIDMINIWSHSTFSPKPSNPGPGFYALGGAQRLMQHIDRQSHVEPTILYTDLAACHAYANGDTAAHAIQCPTLFLLAKHDMMTPPKAAQSLITAIPHATVIHIEASGHAVMAEQPDTVLAHLFRFATTIVKDAGVYASSF